MVRSSISTSVRAAADVEDAAGVVAADRELVGARAVDRQVAGDGQLAAGQGDRAVHGPWSKRITSAPGWALASRTACAQRAGAAVGQVQDREGAGDRTVLQGFDRQHRPPRPARSAGPGEASGRTARRPGSIGMT